jgi:hypothetical protein
MTPIQNTPRVGQKIGEVMQEGGGLVAKMGLWLQQYLKLVGRNPVTTLTLPAVGPSPYTYQNTGDFDIDAVVTGGVVSIVSFSRDQVTFYTVATATGTTVRLNPGDSVRITWSGLPSLILIPR